MSKPRRVRAKHAKCAVAVCKDEHKSLLSLPTCEDTRNAWLKFIFNDNVPATVSPNLYVCAHHFVSDCFANEGQYKAGFATKLLLKDGSVPSVRDPNADLESASSSLLSPLRNVGCQTDLLESRTFGTQLSMRTLQHHIRSTGTQATVSCRDFGVGTLMTSQTLLTSTPAKRPHLDLDDDEEEEEDSFSMEVPEPHDSTYNPADTVTVSTESTDVSRQASSPVQNIPKYIVYETCLLELFEACPLCKRGCEVRTRRLGTFLAVDQRCPHCQFFRQWKSQPAVGSTPAGNLQLSAAICFTGASFFKLEKVE